MTKALGQLLSGTRHLLVGLAAALLLAACATIRDSPQAPPSLAFDRPQETPLGRAYTAAQARQPGLSGFRFLNNGVSALLTRAALIDAAERSIDLQTYIFDADAVGVFLLDRLLAAAKRGVRVRLLLDDYLIGFDDDTLAHLVDHPNFELRLFNPYRNRLRWTRPLQMLFNLDSLGRRMHNKILVVDGQAGIMGGRNIGNHYFEGEGEANFRDADLLVTGPVMREAGAIFDTFWNSRIVVPVQSLGADGEAASDRFASLREQAAGEHGPSGEYRRRRDEFARRVLSGEGMLWATARAIGEPPVRQAPGEAKPSSVVARAMAVARQQAHREVLYVTAYFVPGQRGVEVLGAMAARGVRVRVLTNSLASTDVVAVHAGYAPYREALLEAGVELHEYRPHALRPVPAGHRMRIGRSDSTLHAKVAIYDRRLVWVGSANFDPRSRRLNTEAGLLIESAEIADRLLASLERDFGPENSWRLSFEPGAELGRRIIWNGEQDGRPSSTAIEPDAGLWRFLGVGLYSLLPGLEDLL